MALNPVDPNGSLVEGGLANAASQGDFRQQIANITDLVRQVAGDAAVVKGAGAGMDPLTSPFHLYVNPFIGSDRYVAGAYNEYENTSGTPDEQVAQKLKRVEQQQLVCGYSPQRPFKTINRAVVEAVIVTTRGYYNSTDPKHQLDCVVIHLSPGLHVVLNDPGALGAGGITAWNTDFTPTEADLIALNPPEGGLILPRYASVSGPDLRKVTVRPSYVPPAADEAADFSNRSAIFRVTASGYYFGFSFFDKLGATASHHLLSCFAFATQAQLDTFYAKATAAVGTGSDLATAFLRTRASEWVIAAPVSGTPTQAWDTVVSASPYIFNISIRSNYGLAGIFADGDGVGGFRSMVTAQFTGVSLQKDLSCWEVYNAGTWATVGSYADYIDASPDDVRMKPARVSRHISAVNNSVIQEVSVFAIGQGIHHYTKNGGELTITNSNSNFGGCAALSSGYRADAFPLDQNWDISQIKVADNLAAKRNNIKQITLGTLAPTVADSDTTVELTTPLGLSTVDPDQPELLVREGYTLKPGSYIWVENTAGRDFRARLAAAPWDPANPEQLMVTAAFINENGERPGEESTTGTGATVTVKMPSLAGKRIYIRRIIDVRTPSERLTSLKIGNTAVARRPLRDFVVQVNSAAAAITRPFNDDELFLVSDVVRLPGDGTGTSLDAEITIRLGNGARDWLPDELYRAGETVLYKEKHWACVKEHISGAVFDALAWQESFVHMPDTYRPESPVRNQGKPVVFDGDSDPTQATTTCGYDFQTVWTTDPQVEQQIRANVDYRGLHGFLKALGFSSVDAHALLAPRGDRTWNADTPQPGINLGTGGAANAWDNWGIEFHRPSVIRLFGQAWEWSGYGNYSKALPRVQKELSPQNKFTYYFTNEAGGRVYGTGFNEDGYQVSPFGVEDISTGETLRVDQLGASEDELDVGVSIDSLTLQDLTVEGPIVAQQIQGPDGQPIVWGEGALPFATTVREGMVEIATNEEVEKVFNEGLDSIPEGDTAGERVVGVGGLAGLKAAVLEEVQLLEPRDRYIYIDGDITYTNPRTGATGLTTWSDECLAEEATIPDEIWTDLKHYRGVHELSNWSGIVPDALSPAMAVGRKLAFRSVSDAYKFFNSRSVLDKSDIVVWFYGESDFGAKVNYRGTGRHLWCKGRSEPLTPTGYGPPVYMDVSNFKFSKDVVLGLVDMDFRWGGTRADPTKLATGRRQVEMFVSPILASSSELIIYNCRFYIREKVNGWVFPLKAGKIVFHIRTIKSGTGSPNSNIVFDIMSDLEGDDYTTRWIRGQLSVTQSANLAIMARRSKSDSSLNGDRSVVYNIDTSAYYGRAIRLHLCLGGNFNVNHQRDNRDRVWYGGTYTFNINAGAQQFSWVTHNGIGSPGPYMNMRYIHTGPKPAAGDANEVVVNVLRATFVDSLGAPTTLKKFLLIDIGTGTYDEFIVKRTQSWSLFEVARLAFRSQLTLAHPEALVSNNREFAVMTVREGGNLSDDFLPDTVWIPFSGGLESIELFPAYQVMSGALDYANAAVSWFKTGQQLEVPVEPPAELDDEERQEQEVDAT